MRNRLLGFWSRRTTATVVPAASPSQARTRVKARRKTGYGSLGLPRFRGQVDRSHAMTLRLSIDDQPNQDQAPVHASAEAGGY